MKQSYVYILFNKKGGALYTGVTNDLISRVYIHKGKQDKSFTKEYDVTKLGYYEIFDDIYNAIIREKQIKAGSRKDKLRLIHNMNPDWRDLYEDFIP